MKRNLTVRMIEEVGRVLSLVCVWEDKEHVCSHGSTYHRAKRDEQKLPGAKMGDEPKLAPYEVIEGDGTACQHCGLPAPAGLSMLQGSSPLWSNGQDKPQPGDMYWASWYHGRDDNGNVICHIRGWENCTDPRGHLVVILPNGWEWDIDSRASNCDMKDDKTHRCWVRHGEPPHITVDKNGHTCHAGAGSIIGGDWHGFLRNGVLEEC